MSERYIHFKTQPGPVAKNATPCKASGWEWNPRPWISRPTLYRATEVVALSLDGSSVYIQVVMPVKCKGILKIIFGVYTRCQQMKLFKVSWSCIFCNWSGLGLILAVFKITERDTGSCNGSSRKKNAHTNATLLIALKETVLL